MSTLLTDKREIRAIYGYGEAGVAFEVKGCSKGGFDKIEVYGEEGQMSLVPWFAVWRDGQIVNRINAAWIETVAYKAQETPGN